MNLLDLLILLAAFGAGVGGYRLGFVARATSWAGLALGVLLASLALPTVVGWFDARDGDAVLLSIGAIVLAVGAFVGQAVGLMAGRRVHIGGRGWARRADATAGALAGVAGVVVVVWLLAPAMADVPDWPARQARTSRVVRTIDDVFPRAPDTAETLRDLVGERYPQVFDSLRAAPRLGPPPAETGLSTERAATVASSTVRVVSQACSSTLDGSGFVVGENLIATNAHVVAGADDVDIDRFDGRSMDGTVVAFDPDRDVALVRVPGLDRPALPLHDAADGAVGGVFGHPGGGPLRVAPFEVHERTQAVGSDIYDQRRTRRDVLYLSASLQPGDSGSALVDEQGRALGMAFAVAPDRPSVAYGLAVSELRVALANVETGGVDTGPCID